ncbi:uncharacterized protein PHACADRAFT_28616 [Phanerochaete carnosa HHB-10118-sp]|uniref:U4/U6.U5 small nuclear ribonucleoprotein 27kDa protein domain-containing protein n=1 Tax=Phanerochaete carnosa (strain HHB-10118-sp) TaxID=650164 RepID=K5W8R2_PHACS|nr:uncharacterized protein PHACADRAFT_28616 [Phanerochaete carnosa HHB-10118-sp]EKM55595.1 hypothetical protein PHACADRAFT_28616 [Phanerochaete carnosa HHB-10118-sp]
MSSRFDDRRREYDRDDRGARYTDRDAPHRGGRSRSRSPRRGGGDKDRDKRPTDRRDHHRDDRDYHRDNRRRDDRDRRDHHRDDRRDARDRDRDKRDPPRRDERGRDMSHSARRDDILKPIDKRFDAAESRKASFNPGSEEPKSRQVSEVPTEDREEGNAMDQEPQQDEEAAMMAMMGLPMQGFGSTKGKHVEGNQEGSANVKKVRTWRQYMNRSVSLSRYPKYDLTVHVVDIDRSECDAMLKRVLRLYGSFARFTDYTMSTLVVRLVESCQVQSLLEQLNSCWEYPV